MFKEKFRWINTGFAPNDLMTMLPEGKVRVMRCDGNDIGFAKSGNHVHAFQPKCPHMQYSMDGGFCEDTKVVCPIHRYAFSLEDGKGHGLCLRLYQTEERSGKLYVGVPFQTLWFL